MPRIRILLLSGGSLIGQNILDVLADRRESIELIATNSVATETWLFDFDAVYLMPETARDPVGFARAFSEILDRHDPDLVIPCRDDDVAFLAAFGEEHPELSARFLCGNVLTAQASVDKRASWEFARLHGLPFAPSATTPLTPAQARAFAEEHGFPLVVKPRWGFASHGVRIVVNEAQLLRSTGQPNLVIQPYLGDPENVTRYLRDVEQLGAPLFHTLEDIRYSFQIFIAPDGTPAGRFFSHNISCSGTSVQFTRYEDADSNEIADRCHDAFSRAGWRGPLNIQCQLTPQGNFAIYEFNGRFSGGTAARHRMGFDEPALAIRSFTGRELPASRPCAHRFDHVSRRAFDIGSRHDLIRQLERERLWHRPKD